MCEFFANENDRLVCSNALLLYHWDDTDGVKPGNGKSTVNWDIFNYNIVAMIMHIFAINNITEVVPQTQKLK